MKKKWKRAFDATFSAWKTAMELKGNILTCFLAIFFALLYVEGGLEAHPA